LEERIDLSACYLRLDKASAALRVLEAVPQEQRNFLVLANLATAYQRSGLLERAIPLLEQALKVWPASWPGVTPEQLRWYRRAERYHLTLLKARYQQQLRQPGKEADTLDALFPRVRFVGRSGRYEAGELAPEQWDELPPDALQLVTQLVLWLPFDNPLYWM